METTVLLSDEDAKARGLTADSKAKTPTNKQAAPANKATTSSADKRAEAVSRAFGQKKPAGGDAD
jgi:hypothetical protein